MQTRRTALWALPAMLLSFLPLGCEEEVKPAAHIAPSTVKIKVGETVQLRVMPRAKGSYVTGDSWTVEPKNFGKISTREGESGRASFTAAQAGEGKILIHGVWDESKERSLIDEVPVRVE